MGQATVKAHTRRGHQGRAHTRCISGKLRMTGTRTPSHWEDSGCQVSDSCLTCPLPQCKYDDPQAFLTHQRQLRDQRIRKTIVTEGLNVNEAAQRFSVTVCTIFRAMQRTRRTAA